MWLRLGRKRAGRQPWPGPDDSPATAWTGRPACYAVASRAGIRVCYRGAGTGRRESRAFRYLADEAGIRQFLDIGTDLPSANNVHEVAQAVAPESRVVYVDNDPIVLAHARALLSSAPEGRTAFMDAGADSSAPTGKAASQARPRARVTAVPYGPQA